MMQLDNPGWTMVKYDVEAAFTGGKLQEEIYVELPELAVENGVRHGRLIYALYGLVQAARVFLQKVEIFLTQTLGFKKNECEPCIMSISSMQF